MAINIPLKFRKKGYDSSDDGGEGIVVFNSDEKNIYVGGEKYGETKLAGLTDTTLTSPTNDQVLLYESSSSKWINATLLTATNGQIDALFTGFSVTITAGTGGTATSSANNVSYGGSVTLTATPSTNYSFVQWSDGNTDNPRTITNVQNNITLSATFAINGYMVTVAPTRVLNPSDAQDPDYTTDSALIHYGNSYYSEVLVSPGGSVSFEQDGYLSGYYLDHQSSMYGYYDGSNYTPDITPRWLGIEYSTNNGTTWTKYTSGSVTVNTDILVRGIQTGFIYDLQLDVDISQSSYTSTDLYISCLDYYGYVSVTRDWTYGHTVYLPIFDGLKLEVSGHTDDLTYGQCAEFQFNAYDINGNSGDIYFSGEFDETIYFGQHSNPPQGTTAIDYHFDYYTPNFHANFWSIPEQPDPWDEPGW